MPASSLNAPELPQPLSCFEEPTPARLKLCGPDKLDTLLYEVLSLNLLESPRIRNQDLDSGSQPLLRQWDLSSRRATDDQSSSRALLFPRSSL